MRRILGVMLAVTLIGVVPRAEAQMFGNPVYVPVGMGTGVNFAGDFGLGVNDASQKTTYFGARATLGLPFLYVAAGFGSVKPTADFVPDAEREMTYGGYAGINLLRLPMVPLKISAQVGAGYINAGGIKHYDIPIALGIGVSLPTPGVGITPWVAPRLHLRYSDPAVGDSDTDARFGVSGGVNLRFGLFGVHAAMDYVRYPGSGASPLVFGVGGSVGLTLPGI